MNPFYFFLLIISSMAPLFTKKEPAFILEKKLLLEYLPSGSAMAVIKKRIFIAGDDSPYLFELTPRWGFHQKYLLLPRFDGQQRIAKPVKPDFESMAWEETAEGSRLYLFGSGSKLPERALLLQVALPQPKGLLMQFSLLSLYSRIIEHNGGSAENLNLEGAFIHDKNLFLLNRAGNQLIKTSLDDFKEFLVGNIPLKELDLSFQSFQLPGKANVPSGFSGACTIPGTSKIVFTATLEDTDNWIDDGEILGSYLGVIDLQARDERKPALMEFVTNKGDPFTDKLESVAFNGTYANGDIKLLAIADNDDGTTLLFEFRLLKDFL